MTAPSALTLVVPAYNEADRLVAGLSRLTAVADAGAIDLDCIEVLFVDDGSTDSTRATATSLAASLPCARVVAQPRNAGKGAAVRRGFLEATGDLVAFCDADMAIDPAHLPALVAALSRAPIAVGSRAVAGHVDYGSAMRTHAGRGFNRLVRTIGGVHLADTQCGFKGFRRPVAVLLAQLQTDAGYAFDVELLWLAARLGLDVEEVPVTWLDVTGSSVRVVRDSVTMLLDVAAARRRRRVLAVTEVHDDVTHVPDGTVLLEAASWRAVCGQVSSIGALRDAYGTAAHVEVIDAAELFARAPVAVSIPA